MDRPTAETTAIVTFVVRFWREWSAGQPRWRGRVEHVESRQRGDFLHLSDLLGFLGSRNVLPKYGFPIDVVELQLKASSAKAQELELQRDLRIA
ncbi:MAG: hypothetical protein ACK2U9_05345, partial [Anaerolineae bacterium]